MSIRSHGILIFLATLGASALAQKADVMIASPGVHYFNMEMGPGDKAVKGAPYSADAITETVQVLANGNRIVHKLTSQMARDSQGRTRREQNLDAMGPWAAAGEPMKFIAITDPVAGVMYHLDPKNNTASKIPMAPPVPDAETGGAAPEGGRTIAAAKLKTIAEAKVKTMIVTGGVTGGIMGPPESVDVAGGGPGGPGGFGVTSILRMKEPGEAKSETLGQQTIEGVLANGTRTTRAIPAGAIGNEQPIEIVSETWYSPELQMVVMSKHNDPQFGETTYRLANIQRGEPAQSLFEVPANYTMREEPMMRMKMEHEFTAPLPPPAALPK